jgi:carotenoid cleavage dioxygenase-like enzyme
LIKCFKLPQGWFAQEPRFVPRADAQSEDDGYLLVYVFDESQVNKYGLCKDNAASELWILDARAMTDIVCRVHLPQRVPYGFHGMFFTEKQISQQRAIASTRKMPVRKTGVMRKLQDVLLKVFA